MDPHTAWTKLADAPEGTPERTLSELLRRRGVDFVLRTLQVERETLGRWVDAGEVPASHAALLVEGYKSAEASERRAGVSKIDVERAQAMRAENVKLDAIAAEFGVSKQGVHWALNKDRLNAARKKRARRGSDAA